jgi:hypothetical protein
MSRLILKQIASASVATPDTDKVTVYVDTDNMLKTKDENGQVVAPSRYQGVTLSPAQIVANTNDYNPTGLAYASVLRLSTDASRNLTSLAAQAGAVLEIWNVGAFDLVLTHDDGATGTAANRFYCPNDASHTIRKNGGARISYDSTSSRWRVLAA